MDTNTENEFETSSTAWKVATFASAALLITGAVVQGRKFVQSKLEARKARKLIAS